MSDEHHQEGNSQGVDRRSFFKTGMLAGLGALTAASVLDSCSSAADAREAAPEHPFSVAPLKKVRIGMVGVGLQGTSHVRNFLGIPEAQIVAVCDIRPERAAAVQKLITGAGHPEPRAYTRSSTDFIRLCEEEDLDLVFTATPWEWHVPVCLHAMKNGKHAATEVPAAVTVEECWQLVEAAEKYRKHCVMMENCCYDREELLILNLVRKGMLGELINAEAGYLHDLRGVKFGNENEAVWRLPHSIRRNGNLYPTHGLGPVAQCMNINRGDRFDFLVSMSCNSRGLNLYAAHLYGADDPRAKQTYALGDVNTSLIRTELGKTITLIHDTSSPRPYTRINRVQGTRGLAEKWPNRIYIEGKSKPHQWDDLESYYPEHAHPLWKELEAQSAGSGHGGMDFIEDYRLIWCLTHGQPMDMDVYDAAAWSCISELSERSVARRSRPMDVPDFTRGRWRVWPQLGIVTA
ncbi:MAG TPA: Gfo/Idh/MocA family oxidoreductase [bacterium]|nr:Gfo/Idh/MocA family oxidoreductase [bacterium]HQJ65281.1 Gfo/Idh/MocA family oxidoreductase [bacterium]